MGSNNDKYSTSVADYELWALAHREKEPSKTSRFVTVSAMLHIIAVAGIIVFTIPMMNQDKPETITIEIEDLNPVQQVSKGMDVPETQGPPPAQVAAMEPEAAKVAEKISAEDIVAPAALPAKELPAKAEVAKVLPAKASVTKAAKAPAAKSAATPKSVAAKTNFQAVPATIDDIEAPELDKGDFAKTPVASNDLSDDLNNDFSKAEQKHADELENEKRNMDNMAAALASEQDANLKNAEADAQAEQDRLAQAQDDLRQKNAAAVASALASEKAAADAAAKQAAAREASAAREAAARRARADAEAQALASGKGQSENQGEGAGNNGDTNQRSAVVAGAPTGVRSLDQLRQMPGNPRPQYDREERRRGDQGEIAFVAYIGKDGYVTSFRMLKSTGFRNLDAKTLTALKKWRFYPGQEGWVELPFRWDLKGGVQEDGGLLRRAVSSN